MNADCTQYEGPVYALYAGRETVTGGILDYFYDDGRSTYFSVGGRAYVVQHPNVKLARFDDTRCQFEIAYYADPIYQGNFDE